jgi:hypothetical protein
LLSSWCAFLPPSKRLIIAPIPALHLHKISYSLGGDTCEPPCWFGLIPGESTSEQVAEFFENNLNLFSEQWPIKINGEIDPLTGYLVKGSYSFYWAEDHTPSQLVIPHTVLINDGVFDQLDVRMNKPVTLREMLDILGHPEHLRLGLTGYGDILINAIYETHRIRILLKSPNRFDDCTFSDAGTTYTVSGMTYFSPDAAQRPVTHEQDQSSQPQLTAYYENDLDVPSEQLQKWLNNEETRTCIEVWEILQETSQTTPDRGSEKQGRSD